MTIHTFRIAMALSLLLALAPVAAPAQDVTARYNLGTQTPPVYSQPQIDQLVAPIALYPDQLLGQVLMAATYPLEVVEASRWLQNPAHAGLRGDQLAAALTQQPWEPSVKSLIAFPQVINQMNANLTWTEQLGDAFLAQQSQVMDAVQQLRQQAAAAGNLTSTPQQVVSTQGSEIIIEPANPEVVYVPAYNPVVVYGAWPYPAYQPYYFPGYIGAGLIGFGAGIIVADWSWGWNHWDWREHHIDIDDRRFADLNRGRPPEGDGVWQHDPDHRHGVPYRDDGTREHFQNNVPPEMRRDLRGYGNMAAPRPMGMPIEQRGNRAAIPAPQPAFRQEQGFHPAMAPRPVGIPVMRPVQTQAPAMAPRPMRMPAMRPVQAQRPATPVFESFSRGVDVHMQSQRGSASRAAAAPRARGGGDREKHQ